MTLAFPLYFKITGPGMNQYGKTFALVVVPMACMYFLESQGLGTHAELSGDPGYDSETLAALGAPLGPCGRPAP